MRYARGTTLLSRTPAELRRAERVSFSTLPVRDLLLFDATVSDFFFEFDPEQDIARFLQHAHFGTICHGRLVVCREDLIEVAAAEQEPSTTLTLSPASALLSPFRFTLDGKAFDAIARSAEYRGRITVCSCGIGGCFSQYVWVQDSLCLVLFTVDGASLVEVAWCPFRLVARSDPGL